ncbi:hypothetical protein BpHYR1_016257 [Brachionus plicatilis]|uniref:Uncharacterized protein n=1 Tax=Brachionus plicatilis TaxID=10195 RepID=A0A3M7RIE7_BRAPC|nr:hypothetical protein BpHYR1_016257 [Brachionus plicatilis]
MSSGCQSIDLSAHPVIPDGKNRPLLYFVKLSRGCEVRFNSIISIQKNLNNFFTKRDNLVL